jgi:PGF-CTERM protein
MKSMTKLMVVAMLLVAALVVAPAAARTVVSGDTVYVGEEKLSFGAKFTDPTNITKLVHYSDPTAGTVDKTIMVAPPFELTKSDVGTTTGEYYAFNGTSSAANRSLNSGKVDIQIPTAKLDVMLAAGLRKDSVDGKSVTRKDDLFFKLENNLHGFKGLTGTAYNMSIDVTLPGGGVTNVPFGVDLTENVAVNGTTYESPDLNLSKAEAGTYTAAAKWPKNTDFYDKGFDSNAVTFEVRTKAIAISANKDSVVRGNSFTVTITGRSNTPYYLYIKDAGLKPNEYPWIVKGQKGDVGPIPAGATKTPFAVGEIITTTAGGTRSIQFDTNVNTDDRQFTIRVEEIGKDPDYDEVKVRVEEGDVTITASGTGVYYIGEEITLSGTCTEGLDDKVYLFLTGPNLKSNGVSLVDLEPVENGNATTFKTVEIEADDTWSYKWNTADLVQKRSLDAGGYTIWAVSKPRWKDDLSDANYATASVHLNTAFLTATSSGATVAKGDELKITGTAMGDPSDVKVWIFGKNYYGDFGDLKAQSATVESDGSFEHKLKTGDTKYLAAGQYFVVIQHPMGDGKYGVVENNPSPGYINAMAAGMNPVKIVGLQASDAATALINALDSPNIDDTYVKLTFSVAEPYIFIDPIGDKAAGSKFTITGTTNVAVGDKLIVDVTSAAFGPSKKTEASGFGSVSGSAVVEKGDGANKWSFEVDAADFKPDQYIVKVECIETETTATANFNMVAADETTPTAEVTTTAPAGEVTTTAPAGEATTEATPTPGFGALVALAGLGAVAFLVLRRK